jgi:hypothetical protein
MPEQIIIPELDLPPAAYGADTLTLERCWIWPSEPDVCHPTRDAAVERILERYEDTGDPDLVFIVPVQVKTPHISLWCAACARPLGGDEFDHLHWTSVEVAEREAEDQDWTCDGLRWNCENCPPLQRLTLSVAP